MTELVKTSTCASCGCGAGCQCEGSCGKGGADCKGGPVQRPTFFAGQLLTEDDLQLLSDYVATKSRLHNRFLHGDGVVCGLLVTCHPCGGGKVIVQSGTALDCCGNHIIVPCPVELDINAMVHALRLEKRGGYDCGDPCEKECDDDKDARCVEKKGRRYCLYIRYCEVPEEPVAPYVTQGDCAVQVCKPTRIREGYRFELRCPEPEKAPEDLWHRIRCCIGDLGRADKAAEDAAVAELYYRRTDQVLPRVDSGRVPPFEQADVVQLQDGIKALQPLQRGTARGLAFAVARNGNEADEDLDVRALLDQFQATASAVVRYDLQPSGVERALDGDVDGSVGTARELIQATGEPLRKLAIAQLPSARDRLIADEWISQGLKWTDPQLPQEQRFSRQQLLYAYNVPSSPQLQKQFSRDLNDLRDWLIERLERKPLFSNCRLLRDVLAIDIPADTVSSRNSEASARLAQALLRYLLECICAALNPPCQPCEDSAVVLACLVVDECEVISICNLERTFVLSAPAMRYWLPFLHCLGEFFERICCEPCFRREPEGDREPVPDVFARSQIIMQKTAPAYRHLEGAPQLTALFRLARIDEDTLRSAVNLGGNLATLSARQGVVPAGLDLLGRDIGASVSALPVGAILDRPRVNDTLARGLERDVAELRTKLDEVSVSEPAVKAMVQEQVADRLKEATDRAKEAGRKTEQMLAEANRASAATVKELKAALQAQQKRNDQLEKRLAKLEKAGS